MSIVDDVTKAMHDAEVRASAERERDGVCELLKMSTEREKALETQLATAHVETAKAELRVRELATTLKRVKKVVDWDGGEFEHRINQILAASPDSDARLRELMKQYASMLKQKFLADAERTVKTTKNSDAFDEHYDSIDSALDHMLQELKNTIGAFDVNDPINEVLGVKV